MSIEWPQQQVPDNNSAPTAALGSTLPGYRVPETQMAASADAVGYGYVEHRSPSDKPRLKSKQRGRSTMQRNFSKWLNSAQAAFGWAVVLAILAIASGVYLQQVSRTALIGRNAELLAFELSELRYDNRQIQQQITEAQALSKMQARTEQGQQVFVNAQPQPEDYITVVVPESAELATPAATEPTRPIPPATFSEALKLHIVNYVGALGRGVANGD